MPVDVLELVNILSSSLLGTCSLEVGTSFPALTVSHREAGSSNLLLARSR